MYVEDIGLPTRGVHGNGDGGNTAESAGFPRVWVQILREYRGDGSGNCGIPAGMDFFGGDPAEMVDKCGCEKFRRAYITQTDQTNALTSIE